MIGLSRPQAFTVAIELGIKNGTLGLMVTLTLLQSDAMSVPAAVYGVMMLLVGVLMIGYAAVAYTHLKRPTARILWFAVVAALTSKEQ